MATIAEMLDAAPGTVLTPEPTKVLGAAKLYDMANAMLQYHCATVPKRSTNPPSRRS